MASKFKKKVQEEIWSVLEDLPETSPKYQVLSGIYDKIAKLDDDKAIVNTVWANKDLPLRMFTKDELDLMPGYSTLLIGEPYKDNVDKDKAFGKDWYKDMNKIPYNKIALVAAKEGRSPETLLKEMTDEAIKRNRYDVAHEGVLGNVMPFIAKRTQEAIERGEDPQPEDYALDAAQTALEATPYGRAAKAINNPVSRFLVGRILSNAAAPWATEALDAAVYEDSNPRGKFDIADAAMGTGTNAMGETFLRLGGMGLNKVSNGNYGTRLMNMGDGKSAQEVRREVYGNIDKDLTEIKTKETIGKNMGDVNKKTTNPEMMDFLRSEAIEYYDNADTYATREAILKKLKSMYNSKGKKVNSKAGLSDEDLRYMRKDPVLSKYVGVESGYTRAPEEIQLMQDEGVKNLITNKLGTYQQEQGKAFTRIPFGIGARIQKAYDEAVEAEERRRREEEIMNEYKLELLGGR